MATINWKPFISISIVVSMTAPGTQAVIAQSVSAPPAAMVQLPSESTATTDSFADGVRDGSQLGGSMTKGRTVAIVGAGAGAGLLTFGLGAFAAAGIGPDRMTPEAARASAGRSQEYQAGFKKGWDTKTRENKRKAFAFGAVLGLAFWISAIRNGM